MQTEPVAEPDTHDAPWSEVEPLGVFGYVLAIAISLLALGAQYGLIAAAGGHPSDFLAATIFVAVFGFIPAAFFGAIGAPIVHLLSEGMRSQWSAVAVAAACGLAVGLIVFHISVIAAQLALATAIGRMAVIPYGRRRGRRARAATTPAY